MRSIFAVIIILSLIACNGEDSDAVRQARKLYGKKIEFSGNYISLSASDSISSLDALKKDYKIVTYLDSNACSQCALSILNLWQGMVAEIDNKNTGFVVVTYPGDKSQLKNALIDLKIDVPLLYDTDNKFIKSNKLDGIMAVNRTFLLDKDNRIVIVGEPLNRPNVWQLYKNMLK